MNNDTMDEYSLKGKNDKKPFHELPVHRVILSKCAVLCIMLIRGKLFNLTQLYHYIISFQCDYMYKLCYSNDINISPLRLACTLVLDVNKYLTYYIIQAMFCVCLIIYYLLLLLQISIECPIYLTVAEAVKRRFKGDNDVTHKSIDEKISDTLKYAKHREKVRV